MQFSSRYGVSYPDPVRDDRPDIPLHLKNIVDGLEKSAMYGQGTFALRPVSSVGSPGIQGRFYMATDSNPHVLYYDYGTGWDTIGFIANGSIGTAQLADDSITGGAAGAGVKIKQTTITKDNIVNGTLTAAQIAAASLDGTLLALGTVAGGASSGSTGNCGVAFPTTGLYNGYRFSLVASGGSGIIWDFIYRADLNGTYPWHYLGGSPLSDAVDTAEATSSAAYVALATAGPVVTVPRAGDYRIEHGYRGSDASGQCWMSYDIGATGAVDADAASVLGTSNIANVMTSRIKAGLAATTVLTSKYHSSGANPGTFSQRWMKVVPIRLS